MGGTNGKQIQEKAVEGDTRSLEALLAEASEEHAAELASWVENNSFSVLMAVAEKNMHSHAEKVVKILVKYGADMNYVSSTKQETALMVAAKTNNVSVADQLVKCGANPKLQNKRKKTAADLAKNTAIKTMLQRAVKNWDDNSYQNKATADVSVTSTDDTESSHNKYISSADKRRNKPTAGGVGNTYGVPICGVCDLNWLNIFGLCNSSSSSSSSSLTGVLINDLNTPNQDKDMGGDGKRRYQSRSGNRSNDPGNVIGKKIGFYGGTEENSKATARSTEKFYSGPVIDEEDELTENETSEGTPHQGYNTYGSHGNSIEIRMKQLEGQIQQLQTVISKQDKKIEALEGGLCNGYSSNASAAIGRLFGNFSCFKPVAIIDSTGNNAVVDGNKKGMKPTKTPRRNDK